MNDEQVTALLSEAVKLLRVIARPQIGELQERFSASMLTSANRKAMWAAIDGTKNLAEIARQVGTSPEAVRQFVREIEAKFPDLVETQSGAGGQRPIRRLI